MSSVFKPMLASPADLDAVRYPIYASPKLDGIRASVVGGRLVSRTLKEIPSRHVFNMLSKPEFEGLDGELIVGDPTSPTCYRDTVSHVMADHKVFDFAYYVFDKWDEPSNYGARLHWLHILLDDLRGPNPIKRVQHVLLNNRDELDAYEAEQVALGHEGIMLAAPTALYKFGRATTKGGELLKVKRFEDSEARVIGFEEEQFNGNAAETNELGRTKRSTAKAGLTGKGSMGALIVRDVQTKVEFNIGTGFTAADRAWWWDYFAGRVASTEADMPIIKYKHFPIGVKDKPRHPVFLGMRPSGA
jgi:DNA ligase 1